MLTFLLLPLCVKFKVMSRPNAKTHLLYKWHAERGEECFKPLDGYMHCTLCNTLVGANRRVQLVHHLYSPFRMAIEFQQQQHQQQQRHRTTTNAETESFVDAMDMEDVDQGTPHTERSFDLDLCAALHAAKIPLCVLNNAQFRSFLKKYTRQPIPDENFMRWRYAI